LTHALEEQRGTALYITTALFNQYAQMIPHSFARLRFLLTGGERNAPESFAGVLRAHCPEHLIHCYGPTETTTFAIT
jgi:non-ribosomal peptide synthetase component F